MDQVAVGRVELDHAEACVDRAPGGRHERLGHGVDLGLPERQGRRVAGVEGDRAGPDDLPPAGFGRLEARAARPGGGAARLPAGVGELDAGNGPHPFDERGDPGERLGVPVGPEAEVAGSDPAVGGDRRRLDDDQAHPPGGAAPQVDEVPVVRETVDADILAHGRHRHPVAHGYPAQRQRREQEGGVDGSVFGHGTGLSGV